MFFHTYQNPEIIARLRGRADAVAKVLGSREYREAQCLLFDEEIYEVIKKQEITDFCFSTGFWKENLPLSDIHTGGSCTGNDTDPFADAGSHYDNTLIAGDGECPHPYHAGDLPPLFVNDGSAFMIVATNRFTVEEVVGRTVIVHAHVDDFHSQPAGDAGERIACGVIRG